MSPLDHHDFTQLGAYATYFPIVIGSTKSKLQFNTVQDAIVFAKTNPGKINFSTAGVGQSWWVAAMAFVGATGINVNSIPQPGTGAMTVAQVAGGHAELGVAALGSAKSMIEAGQVKFLATLGEARAPAPYDKIPTAKELGFQRRVGIDQFGWARQSCRKRSCRSYRCRGGGCEDPEFVKFANEPNTRWEYIAPANVNPMFDKRRAVVRDIMSKAGILKEVK